MQLNFMAFSIENIRRAQSDYDNSICFQKRDEQTIFECAGFGSEVKWSGRNIANEQNL